MEIIITISERHVERIIKIGLKQWKLTTDEERKEYEHLINLYGTKVLLAVCNR